MKYITKKALRFTVMLLVAVFVCGGGIGVSYAQQLTVSGVVTDEATDEPMVGVTVICPRTQMGGVTDVDGKYTVKVTRGDVLEFSYVGMKTESVTIVEQTRLDVAMVSDAVDVETVMVVAYGTAKKSSFTGSAEVVGSKQLESRPVSNITKALDGNVAGIQTTSGGGAPGSGAQILIRGIGSINASSTPLYVVDGAPYDGSINSISPDDIASVTVLKDASAAALYGSRAANGVIIVTTKRGSAGRTVINFKGSVGVMQRALPEYEQLSQGQYMEANYDYVRNQLITDGMDADAASQQALNTYMGNLGGEKYNPFNIASNQLIDPATGKLVEGAESRWNDNWLDAAMRDVAIRQDYQLSARGGNDLLQYFASMGYTNEDGIAINTGFERLSTRVSLTSQVKPWINMGLSAAYSMVNSNNIPSTGYSQDNIWYAGRMIAPIYPLYERDDQGALVYKDGQPVYDFGVTRPNQKNFNSVALLRDDQTYGKSDNLNIRASLELGDKNMNVKFLRDLRFKMTYSMDYTNSQDHQFYNPFTGNAVTTAGKMYKTQRRMSSYTLNEMLSYNKSIKGHTVDVMVGHEFYEMADANLSAARTGFLYNGANNLGEGSTIVDANSSSNLFRLDAFLSRVNYNYKDRYFFEGSYRIDGSSRFYSDNRWGHFWSIGGSWRISEENFMRASRRWLDNLSLKASYGVQGNDGVGTYYAWQQTYKYGFANGSYPGVYMSQLENKNLKWEMNKAFNVGIDARFLKGRLGASIEYYHRNTDDLLLYRPLPLSSGFDGIYENVGNMANDGVEITINATPVVARDFRWQTMLIIGHMSNKVLKLSDGQDRIITGNQVIQVGSPIYSFYLSRSLGVDPNTGDEIFAAAGGGTTTDGALAEREIMGSRIPDVSGSFNNIFSYKGLELAINISYSVGGSVLDNNYISMMSTDKFGSSWHKDMERRWRKPGDVTDVPRLESGMTMVASDRYLKDASYLSLRNVTLGYTFNFKNRRQVGISALRLYLSGDNLATLSALKGMDPQASFVGSTSFAYAPVSTISFGVDLTF